VAYTQSNSPGGNTEAPNFLDPFFVIETTCTAWFTLVFGTSAPSRRLPWKSASRSYHRLVYPQVSWTLPHPRSPASCTAWFTLEAIVRFIACPSKIDFWKDFKNIVDVTADVHNIQVRVQDGAVNSTVSAAPKLFYVARVFLGVKWNASST